MTFPSNDQQGWMPHAPAEEAEDQLQAEAEDAKETPIHLLKGHIGEDGKPVINTNVTICCNKVAGVDATIGGHYGTVDPRDCTCPGYEHVSETV